MGEIGIFIFGIICGVTFGYISAMIFNSTRRTYGIIAVDHETEQCIVRITSNEVGNRKNKKAIFEIDHDAHISRKEQVL